MSSLSKKQFLKDELSSLIQKYRKERVRHKRTALLLKVSAVTLAGIITVLVGWKSDPFSENLYRENITLVLGAGITLISAYDAFFDPRTLWVQETLVLSKLLYLKRELNFQISNTPDDSHHDSILDSIKQELDQILEESLKEWLRIRKNN
ncbi:SLATT domain-containing protein [Undibacterium sp. Ji22W]|uniref:SLATT domain-containing protein n=1 Tax=Undibacterium sp. Ji22W TaxID=3413038 RepID=UPI003BF3C1FE